MQSHIGKIEIKIAGRKIMKQLVRSIARMGAVLANDGIAPWNEEGLIHKGTTE